MFTLTKLNIKKMIIYLWEYGVGVDHTAVDSSVVVLEKITVN